MRAHQPGSTPIDIPETVPNPAYTPAPAPTPERPPTRVPEKVPEKVIAPESSGAFFLSVVNTPSRRDATPSLPKMHLFVNPNTVRTFRSRKAKGCHKWKQIKFVISSRFAKSRTSHERPNVAGYPSRL